MSPDRDFAWLEEIALSDGPPDEVVQAGDVAVVVRRRNAGDDDLITSRPEVMGGRRVFRGTRVPVECLWDNLDDGLTVDEVLDCYPTLSRADVLAVIERGLR